MYFLSIFSVEIDYLGNLLVCVFKGQVKVSLIISAVRRLRRIKNTFEKYIMLTMILKKIKTPTIII